MAKRDGPKPPIRLLAPLVPKPGVTRFRLPWKKFPEPRPSDEAQAMDAVRQFARLADSPNMTGEEQKRAMEMARAAFSRTPRKRA